MATTSLIPAGGDFRPLEWSALSFAYRTTLAYQTLWDACRCDPCRFHRRPRRLAERQFRVRLESAGFGSCLVDQTQSSCWVGSSDSVWEEFDFVDRSCTTPVVVWRACCGGDVGLFSSTSSFSCLIVSDFFSFLFLADFGLIWSGSVHHGRIWLTDANGTDRCRTTRLVWWAGDRSTVTY